MWRLGVSYLNILLPYFVKQNKVVRQNSQTAVRRIKISEDYFVLIRVTKNQVVSYD
jgi:hypothetical protein